MTRKGLFKRNEFYVLLTIILLGFAIQWQSGQFFSANNFVDLARSMIVPGMLCMGLMMEIISGGIDVSFPSIAMLSMYSTIMVLQKTGYEGPVALAFVLSAAIGLALGLINGLLIHWLKLPAFIITLGTGSIYLGFMQAVLKSRNISILPKPVAALGKQYLFTVTNSVGQTSSLPVVFLYWWWWWRRWPFAALYHAGPGHLCLGGDRWRPSGRFNILGLQLFVYGFMGCLAGFVGMTAPCSPKRPAHHLDRL